jgi:hypothetical protein
MSEAAKARKPEHVPNVVELELPAPPAGFVRRVSNKEVSMEQKKLDRGTEEIMRLVKLQQFKDAANKPREDEARWDQFISVTMQRAEVLLDKITRPPTELWALREKFLDDVFGIATLTPKDGEIPEPDMEEIEAMFAPKAKAEFHRRI